jgi:acetylornithine deacetylase/succinyl-diaminopimelate desuccinylase-like protein
MMQRTGLLAALATVALLATGPAQAAAPANVRADARAIFEKIVSIPTSEGLGKVPEMAQYLADRFLAAGFPAADIHILPSGETASLVVRYRGTGEGGKPIIVLSHMDVVTARREDWQRDPFQLIEEDGYFFGRGTEDVKGEIAVITATFLRLRAEEFVPARDLILVFTGDEETTAASARELVTTHRALIDAEYALNSDGGGGRLDKRTGRATHYNLQGAEKSYASFELEARNPGGHSSEPRPDNAIYEIADALRALQAFAFPVQWNEWTIGSFRAQQQVVQGEEGAAMARFAAHPGDPAAAAVLARNPALVGRTRTTCVPTLLQGGHAENALPQSATATINCRVFPGTTAAQVRDTLQQVVGSKVEVKTVFEPLVGPPSPLREDVLAAVTRAVHATHAGVPIVPDMAAYATDGTIFRGAGIPTYGVSSLFLKDSERYAHGLNERIKVEAFYDGLDHWYALLRTLAGGK